MRGNNCARLDWYIFRRGDSMKSISEYRGVDFARAHYVLRRHYDLGRPLTTDEIKAEVDNLIRRRNRGSLDDIGEYLISEINFDGAK